MTPATPLDKATGALLVLTTAVMVLVEWGAAAIARPALPALVILVTALLTVQVRPGRSAFVAVAVAMTVALAVRDPGWESVALRGLHTAAFIGAFFTALATLRSAAEPAPAIRRAGRFLAQQPPGRRYLALTVGGQMFALVLNYGAIALLGSLATASAAEEADPEIRRHRTRRMLLAIQRAFTSTLPWSPLSFAVAISTALIPGASWGGALIPGLVTSVLMAGTGWALDSIFKPRLSGPRPPAVRPEGGWDRMAPLAILLAILVGSIVTLHLATGIRVVGLVILIVPLMAAGWLVLQTRGAHAGPGFRKRLADYVFVELPGFRGEIVLLMMAGYIGTVGAPLLQPLMTAAGVDLSAVPPWMLLVSFVWIIPLAGQLGMNPILAVTLAAPLIPSAAALGVAPTAIIVAITAGWALSGVTSPFTATTLLIGSFGKVSARHVGLRWNGGYFLVAAIILSAWVLVYAQLG
ncbi:hypothetical protein ACQ5SP_01195 [Rhodovulum sp. YNF3179]|uniref:hypothetical protein n=1 Tax=Rhodovulum sp. YNF3179 TaxID=3425127 RepID=UPI003D35899C